MAMAPSPKRVKKEIFTRAIALYVPWPKVAGTVYDRDAIYNGVDRIGCALSRATGSSFNHFDNVTCESFVAQLVLFIQQCREADPQPTQMIVYVSAHGEVNEKAGGELHLMMQDSPDPNKDEIGARDKFWGKSIRGEVIRGLLAELMRAVPGGKVWFLLDSCHSGALFFKSPPEPQLALGSQGGSSYCDGRLNDKAWDAIQGGSGLIAFMSCGPNERSWIDPATKTPCFTEAVASVLEGDFLPGQGIRMEEVVRRVKEKVVEAKVTEGRQHPCAFPPLWSERGSTYGYVGVGIEGTLDPVEAMEIDESDGNIEVIPEESSPDDVKLYYDKHDKALRELAADVASYVPANIRKQVEKLQKEWVNYNFEGAKKLVLCGETGHGKSTLLNALVGAPVLPAKCDGDACTKVPIELHSSKDETLQVEIEFLPSMQRKDELERQFSLWSYEGDDENQDPALKDDEFESLVQDACKSLEDLFDGSIPGSLEGILKINAQIDEMDSAHFFESPEDTRDYLEANISKYYPLIRVVRISIPINKIPRNMVLVDIPGHHDVSAVRRQIANKQFEKADINWIVCDIRRALSNETPKMLVDNLMNGSIDRISTLAIICTHNDQCGGPCNMESKFRKHEDDPNIKGVQKEIQELHEQYRKGKRKEISRRWKLAFVKWRGLRVKRELQERLEKDLSARHIPLRNKVDVISVSGEDYLHISRRANEEEEGPTLFDDPEETGVPALQRSLQSIVDKHNRVQIERFCRESARLCKTLESKVCLIRNDEDKAQWEKAVLKVLAEIGKVTKELRASSFENVESAKKAVEAKVKSFPERVDKVIEKCRKKHHRTIRALLDNGGSFNRVKKGRVDINAELVEGMTNCANEDCAREFQSIRETFHEFEKTWIANENVAQALKDLRKAKPKFTNGCFSLCQGKVREVVETLTDHMNTSITSAIRSSGDEALSHLKPLYDEWKTKSADYRTKEELLSFISGRLHGQIGQSAVAAIAKSLRLIIRSVQNNIKCELDAFDEEIGQMLTTELEGFGDAEEEMKGKLCAAVQRFKRDIECATD